MPQFDLVDGSAYLPCPRSAFARYQPYAVDSLHLSKVVTGEFVQVPPGRTVTAAMTADGRIRVELSGPAAVNDTGEFAGPGREGMAASRRVTVTVRQRARSGATRTGRRPTPRPN
ncbi:hypothetical protein [Streptomyces sp. NPDC018045]|uniref:hypothetical protein n=1 Tax=Streptomyces sp. NPDC018045 TaxID=3365037 RepID=UPI0037BA0D9E